jgi:sugar transferase (PEP-CTERM/EpsH1 system associated)
LNSFLAIAAFALDTIHMQTQAESKTSTQPNSCPSENVLGTQPVRVLHVISYLGRGGAEMGILKLVGGLGPAFDHKICTTRGFDPEFVRSHFSEQNVEAVGTPEAGLQFPLFRLMRVIRRYRPHIVHTRNWGAVEAMLAAKLAGVRAIVHSEHGYEVDMIAGLAFRRRLFRRGAYALADSLFAVTDELRYFHARQAWISPDRIGVLHNGVDTEYFSPSEAKRINVRKELGLPPNSYVVGSVGRLVPIKDHKSLLKAAEMLLRDGMDVRVLLVGSGPEQRMLESEAAGLLKGRVVFVGDSSRVPEMLNAMDVFVLPSLSEGMSNTLLEAMSCGLAVIATSAGGNPEIVENQISGNLFAPGDVYALFEKLKLLAHDTALSHQLGAAARQRSIHTFSLSRMLENYRNLYLKLIADNCPATSTLDTAHVRN